MVAAAAVVVVYLFAFIFASCVSVYIIFFYAQTAAHVQWHLLINIIERGFTGNSNKVNIMTDTC